MATCILGVGAIMSPVLSLPGRIISLTPQIDHFLVFLSLPTKFIQLPHTVAAPYLLRSHQGCGCGCEDKPHAHKSK